MNNPSNNPNPGSQAASGPPGHRISQISFATAEYVKAILRIILWLAAAIVSSVLVVTLGFLAIRTIAWCAALFSQSLGL